MSVLNLDAFEHTPLRSDICDFIVVPRFVKPEALAEVNRDYPLIERPGNFPPEELRYGPAFSTLLEELEAPDLRQRFSDKFHISLDHHPLQLTVRKYSEADDGNVHNDSKMKIVTVLIYFNESWPHENGRLRLTRSLNNVDDYVEEVEPSQGTLIAFRRNDRSFHGFRPFVGERRSIQMYWVSPKRAARGEKTLTLKRRIKRWLKVQPR